MRDVARAALGAAFLGGLLGGALWLLNRLTPVDGAGDADADASDPDVAEAAALLGVGVDASPDEVRAALRDRLAESRLHPDHGGDGDEAARLIAAKNLLVERARGGRS